MDRVSNLRSPGADYESSTRPSEHGNTRQKLVTVREMLRRALLMYDHPAVIWRRDVDSTLVLYLVREMLDADDGYLPEPTILFLDHGQHFTEVIDFVVRWGRNWRVRRDAGRCA